MPHTVPSLPERLNACLKLARAWKGVIYRVASVRYASSLDLVNGKGALAAGGRWHPPGLCRAVYGSLDAQTAFAESLAVQVYYGLPVHLAMPKVVAALHIDLQQAVDLHDQRVAALLRMDIDQLARHDWRKDVAAGNAPASQQLGQAAFQAGVEALLVPSNARPGQANLVIFPDNLRSGSVVTALGADTAKDA